MAWHSLGPEAGEQDHGYFASNVGFVWYGKMYKHSILFEILFQYSNTRFYILFEILCNTLFDIHLKYDNGNTSYSYTMYMIYKGMI